jgi:hypothetical protein
VTVRSWRFESSSGHHKPNKINNLPDKAYQRAYHALAISADLLATAEEQRSEGSDLTAPRRRSDLRDCPVAGSKIVAFRVSGAEFSLTSGDRPGRDFPFPRGPRPGRSSFRDPRCFFETDGGEATRPGRAVQPFFGSPVLFFSAENDDDLNPRVNGSRMERRFHFVIQRL